MYSSTQWTKGSACSQHAYDNTREAPVAHDPVSEVTTAVHTTHPQRCRLPHVL